MRNVEWKLVDGNMTIEMDKFKVCLYVIAIQETGYRFRCDVYWGVDDQQKPAPYAQLRLSALDTNAAKALAIEEVIRLIDIDIHRTLLVRRQLSDRLDLDQIISGDGLDLDRDEERATSGAVAILSLLQDIPAR